MKDVYKSVLHSNCGGEIVLVAKDKNNACLVCKKCKLAWNTSNNCIPFPQQLAIDEDMYIYEDHKLSKTIERKV